MEAPLKAKVGRFADPLDRAFETAFAKGDTVYWREQEAVDEEEEPCGGQPPVTVWEGYGSRMWYKTSHCTQEARRRSHILGGLQVVILIGIRGVVAADAAAGVVSRASETTEGPSDQRVLNLARRISAMRAASPSRPQAPARDEPAVSAAPRSTEGRFPSPGPSQATPMLLRSREELLIEAQRLRLAAERRLDKARIDSAQLSHGQPLAVDAQEEPHHPLQGGGWVQAGWDQDYSLLRHPPPATRCSLQPRRRNDPQHRAARVQEAASLRRVEELRAVATSLAAFSRASNSPAQPPCSLSRGTTARSPPSSRLAAAKQHIRGAIMLARDVAQPSLDRGLAAPARELGRLMHVLECCGDEEQVALVAADVEAVLGRLTSPYSRERGAGVQSYR